MDARLEYANQRGLAVLLIGLARPAEPSGLKFAVTPEFARYVVARFFGDRILLSLNFDQM